MLHSFLKGKDRRRGKKCGDHRGEKVRRGPGRAVQQELGRIPCAEADRQQRAQDAAPYAGQAAERVGLQRDSVVLLEQMRTIDKQRLKEKMGHLDDDAMHAVDTAISVSLGLGGDTAGGDAIG